jgi:hypothetical protein
VSVPARPERLVFGALALLALGAALLVPTYPNYDSYAHLNWGRELLDGRAPEVEGYAAPTQHPAWIAWTALLAAVFGPWADRALVLGCVLALVGLSWGVWRVGRRCFGPWPAVAAVVFTGSSFAFLLYAARAYLDVPFLALVLWAAAREAERPVRGAVAPAGRGVAGLLAVAGLLRPEAWVLAGGYWLWAGRRRLDLLALAVAAPAAWCAVDLALTGDPLFSVTSTSALAEELGRERGIGKVPGAFVAFLADTARPPVFAAALLGAALAWRERGRLRALHVPVALFGAGAVTFVGTGVLGLSILPRYLTVPAVALCLLAGWAALGFTRLPPGPLRSWWARGAAGGAVVGAVFLVAKAGSFAALARELRFIDETHRQARVLAASPALDACAPVTLPTYRFVPDVRWERGAGADQVVARSAPGAPARGVDVFLAGPEKAVKRFGRAAGVSNRFNAGPPAGARRVGDWFLVADARCRR